MAGLTEVLQEAEERGGNISLPTLGTHYELSSLLSLDTIGRKNSALSAAVDTVDQPDSSDPADKVERERVEPPIDTRVREGSHHT